MKINRFLFCISVDLHYLCGNYEKEFDLDIGSDDSGAVM